MSASNKYEKLNEKTLYIHFKMEGLKNVSGLLTQGDFMFKIEMKDVYWHVPIHPTFTEISEISVKTKNCTSYWSLLLA